MCSYKISVILLVVLVGYVSAVAKPISFEEVGRKLHDFGQKAFPIVRGACGFVNAYQGYPAYPQGYTGYPQIQPQGYPQGFYPQEFYPQGSRTFPQNPNTFVTTWNQQSPPGTAIEQDDLNKVDFTNRVHIPPPQIQDIFKNFDKLPKFDPKSVRNVENEI